MPLAPEVRLQLLPGGGANGALTVTQSATLSKDGRTYRFLSQLEIKGAEVTLVLAVRFWHPHLCCDASREMSWTIERGLFPLDIAPKEILAAIELAVLAPEKLGESLHHSGDRLELRVHGCESSSAPK